MNKLALTTALFLMLVPAAASADDSGAECAIQAYSVDEDPSGLNIRGGPGSAHAVVGTVPFRKDDEPVSLVIAAVEGKWLRLARTGLEDEPKYEGVGWVFGNLVRTNTAATVAEGLRGEDNTAVLYAAPDLAGKRVGAVPGAVEIVITGCDGKWIRTRHEGRTGWLRPEDICGDPTGFCQ